MVLTNIPEPDSLGIWSPAQDLENSLGGLDLACVGEGDKGARLVFEERLHVEAKEGPGRIRLDVVAATKERGIEFNWVARLRDEAARCDINN